MAEPHGAVAVSPQVEQAAAGRITWAEGHEHGEELMCSICLYPAYRDAVEPPCCKNILHAKCLSDWHDPSCPNCRAPLPADRSQLPQPDPRLQALAQRLKVACPQECGGAPIRFDTLARHIMAGGDCPRTPIRCKVPGCGAVTERRGAQAHFESCPQRMEDCPQCAKAVKREAMQSHVDSECGERIISCCFCPSRFPFNEKQAHLLRCPAVTERVNSRLQCAERDHKQQLDILRAEHAQKLRRVEGLAQKMLDEVRGGPAANPRPAGPLPPAKRPRRTTPARKAQTPAAAPAQHTEEVRRQPAAPAPVAAEGKSARFRQLKTQLEQWKKSYKGTHGENPRMKHLWADPVLSAAYKEFSQLRSQGYGGEES